jgi:3-hydroxybutyryl-CoA dehydrogenase
MTSQTYAYASALPTGSTVAVIGAGAMGRGIAQVAAAAGHQVLLYDANPKVAAEALTFIRADLDKLVSREKIASKEAESRLSRLSSVDSLQALAAAVLVIEAIVENLHIKTDVLKQVESVIEESAILATNTSSLSVTEIGGTLSRPQQFAGMHFFNPATILPLVEVVKGAATDDAVVRCLVATASAWGKTPVVCGSTPGFIVNRVARPFYGEAMRLLAEGVSDVATIDALMRESGGFRMGPFELTDLIGQDVNFSVTESVYRGFFGDPRYQPSTLQQELVMAGYLGRKSGRGFYTYENGSAKVSVTSALAGPKPEVITINGSLGAAEKIAVLAENSGIKVLRSEGSGGIQLGKIKLCLTDGRLATERSIAEGDLALFDLALDFEQAERIGLAFADGVADDLRSSAIGFFQALGKQVSVVDDAVGMVVMRTVAMLINEAVDAEHLSVASAEDIEIAMTRGVNYPIGLLKWCRQIGAGPVLKVIENLSTISPDGRYRASPLLRRRAVSEAMQEA